MDGIKQAIPSPEDRVRAIREREQKATKGPWHREGPKNGWGNNIAVCPIGDKEPAIYHSFAHPESVIADADFIAHARADIPYLLSLVEELKGQAVSASLRPTQDQVTTFFLNRYGIDLQSDMWNGQNMVMFALAVCKEFFPSAPTQEPPAAHRKVSHER